MKILLLGATGLVGSHVLEIALNHEQVSMVIAPVRKAINGHPKLIAPIIDFENITGCLRGELQVDAVICAMGTTMKKAGSPEAFTHVDRDYPIIFAKLAKEQGASTFSLNSALGANKDSLIFYNKIKGELEVELQKLGFRSLTFVRPGLIGGIRPEFRLGEKILSYILGVFKLLLPKKWRVNPAPKIAQALLQSALKSQNGVHIISSQDLN